MARRNTAALSWLGGLWLGFAQQALAAEPIKLALFPFELDDFSAAVNGETPADTAKLAAVTDEIGKMLRESGRYQLVDVTTSTGKGDLRDCNGCEAPMALNLGAAQSLIGIVKRISRTEYQVRYRLRDAATGKILAEADTGLRMGALDSWNRGARRLVKDRLLAVPAPQ